MARLLLVEDDPDLSAVLRALLEDAGHVVDPVAACATALTRLGAAPPDAMITNAALPDGSGAELAEAAAAHGVPVLIITGHPERFTDMAAAGRPVLRKPFSDEALQRALTALLKM